MKRIFPLAIFVWLLTSCSSLKITSDYDKAADFSHYKTYSFNGWANHSDEHINDINKRRFEQAFAEEFKSRGFTYVKDSGDVLVSLFIVIDEKTSVTAYTDHYGDRYGYGRGWGWGYGYSQTTYDEYDYQQGTLICDVIDTQTNNLVWQGVGTTVIKENPRKREFMIKEAAKKIMATYPIAPKKK